MYVFEKLTETLMDGTYIKFYGVKKANSLNF